MKTWSGTKTWLRNVAVVAAAGAIVGLAAFWFVTLPAVVTCLGAAAPHARPRERPNDVQYRRLCVLPRHAG